MKKKCPMCEVEFTKEEYYPHISNCRVYYHKQLCNVTPALTKGMCGSTCCTILLPPKPLSVGQSFALFLADFKARMNQ